MFGKSLRLALIATVAAVGTACKNKDSEKKKNLGTATDIQVEKMEAMRAGANKHLPNMSDNAILHDMSLADIHFIPHSAELSGSGTARLDRMAPMLDTYGGTVRFETYCTDEDLNNKRMDHIKEYLTVVGCDTSRVEFKVMMSGGRGMMATKAIEIDKRGTAKPKSGGAAATPLLITPASGSSGG